MEMNSTLTDFIDAVGTKDFAKAEPMFKDMMTSKVGDALDAEKIALANSVYNGAEEEQLELDIEDNEAEEPVEEISSEEQLED